MRTEGLFRLLPTMNLKKWLYRGGRPNWVATLLNRLWAAVHAFGFASNYLVTLKVRGRRSGRMISLPLVMVMGPKKSGGAMRLALDPRIAH
jgi:hypothetical protein